MNLSDIITRIRVVLTNVNTYLIGAATAIPFIISILTEEIGIAEDSDVVMWLGSIAGVAATAIAVIRRVSEVIPEDRGLLPSPTAPGLADYPDAA